MSHSAENVRDAAGEATGALAVLLVRAKHLLYPEDVRALRTALDVARRLSE